MPLQHILSAAGPQAERIVALWWLTVGICGAVTLAVLVAFVLALLRGRAGTAVGKVPHVPVGVAVAVSTLGLLVLIAASVATDRALAKLPTEGALEVEVIGHKWWWEVRYKDLDPQREFTTANELHIPVGRPVRLFLRSDDVIHSFWVPNLGGKKDLIPGREAELLLRADRAGTYRGQCAEFCGAQHAKMAFFVFAEPPEKFATWMQAQRKPAAEPAGELERKGRDLFVRGTCASCHAILGTPANGRKAPDLTHVGSRSRIAAGVLPNEPQALADWIRDPHKHKPGVNMPAHALPKEQLQALAAYLGSLR
ncbi:MAG TPA: cytochrome c oxidase subunit II [Burkholderiales bacterium]|nr:cytochrome c oxidase subunit II [Burkholderiales bacterium]